MNPPHLKILELKFSLKPNTITAVIALLKYALYFNRHSYQSKFYFEFALQTQKYENK